MNDETLFFFEKHMDALPLYEQLKRRILSDIEGVNIKVQKTQITFLNRHLFCCVSFLPVRRKADRPHSYIVVTFGLRHKTISPRIEVAVEPYPGRWTHHVLISKQEEIDDELMGWIKDASVFSARKR